MLSNYNRDDNGVIFQIRKKPFVYDDNYVKDRYSKYPDKVEEMSELRFNNLLDKIGFIPSSVLDIGFGNGSFLKKCHKEGVEACFGSDLIYTYIPETAMFVPFNSIFKLTHIDVTCFFDSLEHFSEIDFVKYINTEYVYISVPFCKWKTDNDDEWFRNWKHRRPDEHLWHFNESSLIRFMDEQGFYCVDTSHVEDEIRQPTSEANTPNILTGIFKKKTRQC